MVSGSAAPPAACCPDGFLAACSVDLAVGGQTRASALMCLALPDTEGQTLIPFCNSDREQNTSRVASDLCRHHLSVIYIEPLFLLNITCVNYIDS